MHIRTRTLVAALTAAGASLLACSKTPEPNYAKDGDTGAAAPATQQTLSPNPQMGDSTQRERTQAPNAAAGDSSGAGRARRDSTTKRP